MESPRPEQTKLLPIAWIESVSPEVMEEVVFHPSRLDPTSQSGVVRAYVVRRSVYANGDGAETQMDIADSCYLDARAAQQADMRDTTDQHLRDIVADLPEKLWTT